MKVQATVLLRLQAGSLADAGAVLDDVLARARERDDVDVGQVNVITPPGGAPVSLPAVSTPVDYRPGTPRPGNADGR